jgi:hypothetical protein
MKKSYFLYDVSSYSDSAITLLEETLKEVGFKKIEPELGGGPSTQQIIAWLVLVSKDLSVGVVSTLIASKLEKSISRLFKWYKVNGSDMKKKPAVKVNIYFERDSSAKSMTFGIDRVIREEEIKLRIRETSSVKVVHSKRK